MQSRLIITFENDGNGGFSWKTDGGVAIRDVVTALEMIKISLLQNELAKLKAQQLVGHTDPTHKKD